MVCAGKPAGGHRRHTTATCNGDSGGPLVVDGKVVGVVSWGVQDCVAKGAYSVFAKVSTYAGAAYPRVDDTDTDRDGLADVFARTPGRHGLRPRLQGHHARRPPVCPTAPGAATTSSGRPTSTATASRTLLRRTTDGTSTGGTTCPLRDLDHHAVGGGWNAMHRIVAPGDLTGDALPDLLTVDSAASWIYPGKGNGTLAPGVKVGSRLEPVPPRSSATATSTATATPT